MKTLLLLCGLCVSSPLIAESATVPAPVSSIRVTAEASVDAAPERAIINVGVLTQDRNSQAATTGNARTSDAVLAALRRLLGETADLKTVSYSVSPDYQYRQGFGRPAVTSFTVSNIIRVTLDDPARVGAVIDAATGAGANHIESVQYTARDPAPLRAKALQLAAARARTDAETLAAALSVRIVRILSAESVRETAPGDVDPTDPDARAPPEAAPPPPGLQFTANVALTVEVSPR
jgi:uncharacterized protein